MAMCFIRCRFEEEEERDRMWERERERGEREGDCYYEDDDEWNA